MELAGLWAALVALDELVERGSRSSRPAAAARERGGGELGERVGGSRSSRSACRGALRW